MVVWCNYLTTKLSIMKKLSVIVSLSLMLSSLSWAEKYEYVRLKAKGAAPINDTFTWNTNTYYKYDSVELKSGDVARVVALSSDYFSNLFFDDGEDVSMFDIGWTNGGSMIQTFVGPGIIYLGSRSENYSRTSVVNLAIQRASDTGSTTLSWNGTEWEGSDDSQLADNNNDNSSPVPDPNGIKYDQLLGWCYFTDTPWIYSYTNGSWYYMHSMQDGIYVWNANLPNNGWMKLHG